MSTCVACTTCIGKQYVIIPNMNIMNNWVSNTHTHYRKKKKNIEKKRKYDHAIIFYLFTMFNTYRTNTLLFISKLECHHTIPIKSMKNGNMYIHIKL